MTAISIFVDSKVYSTANSHQHQTISDFKLSLSSNEFICLVGPSGCGKTTLLNIIAGLDTDYTGNIKLAEQQATPKIGYIFQSPRLLPWRTVRENIELALPKEQTPEIIDSLLDAMQLSSIQDKYPEHISLGMSRRVAIIRAFTVNPDILLMDEPFVSLDAPTARKVRKLLVQLWQKRPHTILFVTHDIREAISLADRIIFLSSSPMSILSEVTISLAREMRNNEAEIEAFRQQLLTDHLDIKELL